MAFSIAGSVVSVVLLIMLYAWAFSTLWNQWGKMSGFWQLMYVLLFACVPGAGPVPVLIMLYFKIGIDSFHEPNPIYVVMKE